MTFPVRSASVALLAVLALSGCAAKESGTDKASSTTSTASASSTASATSASPTTSATSAQSSASATTSSTAVKPTGEKVAVADLPGIVANRTFRGDYNGTPYSEYYTADGALRGKSGDKTYSGTWKVVDEELCFTYPASGSGPAGADGQTECYAVFKDGDVVSWIAGDGGVTQPAYVEGNPDGL